MPLAEVKQIYETNIRSIPDMLRKLADDLESNAHGDINEMVVIFPAVENMEIFMWGEVHACRAHHLLHKAMLRIAE